jgi:hypothetical protein
MRFTRLNVFLIPVALTIVLVTLGSAQTLGPQEVNMPQELTRNGADFWASGGAGVALQGLSASPLINPAGMSYAVPTLYAEGTERFSTQLEGWVTYDGFAIAPSFAVAGVSTGNFNFALGYANTLDTRYSYNLVVTDEQGLQIGQPTSGSSTAATRSVFGSASLAVGDRWSLGITIGEHYLHFLQEVGISSTEGHGYGAILVGGVDFIASDAVSLGASVHYESPTSFIAATTPPPDTLIVPAGPRSSTYYNVNPFHFTADYPLTFDLGLAWRVSPVLSLMSRVELENWKYAGTSNGDVVHLFLGAKYALLPTVDLHAGVFTMDAPPDNIANENFTSLGIGWKILPRLTARGAFLDSHLLSGVHFWDSNYQYSGFRQSSVSVGITYALAEK